MTLSSTSKTLALTINHLQSLWRCTQQEYRQGFGQMTTQIIIIIKKTTLLIVSSSQSGCPAITPAPTSTNSQRCNNSRLQLQLLRIASIELSFLTRTALSQHFFYYSCSPWTSSLSGWEISKFIRKYCKTQSYSCFFCYSTPE